MGSATDRQRRPSASRLLSRRAFIAGGAGAAATAVVPGAAVAQNDSEGEEIEPVFTDAAISPTVPTLSGNDYTGLFVQIVRQEADEDINVGVETCGVLESSEETVAYETRLIDRIETDRTWTSAILYADEDNEEIHDGKLFVVSSQEACSDGFVSLNLERVGAGRIGAVGEEGATSDGGATNTRTPGFGIGTALLGLGGASLAALGRLRE